ncbi:MAG: clostripain-related cysteine peptidase [Candidatus Dependentiae bacterium]|nr:clostripain-related cysteine peptidase [Candidatus Dependentiae bacterium]
MLLRSLSHYALSILLLSTLSTVHADTWKVLFYMDSGDNLSDMAFKNITDMVRGAPNDNVEFLIQLHAYYNSGLRYQVTNNGLVFLQEVLMSGDGKQDAIDAAEWAFANNNADHTMLIFSNHGYGILDPHFNYDTNKWETEFDPVNSTCSGSSCALLMQKKSIPLHEAHTQHKGFMFNDQTKTYLNNQDLIDTLAHIKNTILKGRTLDILAFDTCMGAMLEVGYQCAPFARYLVGNQSCSLLDGFEYQGIMKALNNGNNSPRDVAKGMVNAFDAYYNAHDASGIYTHTALDLEQVGRVCQAVDTFAALAITLPDCQNILDQIRAKSPRFCLFPMYTDIVEFCTLMDTHLYLFEPSDTTRALHLAVHNVQNTVQDAVVARCGGSQTVGLAHGCAIYCPFSHIDSSYYKTLFAQQCQWLALLEKICNN